MINRVDAIAIAPMSAGQRLYSNEPAQKIHAVKAPSLLKLSSNENVLGPSPLALSALAMAIQEAHRYPVEEEEILARKLVERIITPLTTDHLLIGSGSGDVLRMIAQSFLQPGDKTVIAGPTFNLYEDLTLRYGCRPELAPLRHYTVDLPRVLAAIDDTVRLVFICNPNNPTGTIVTHAEVGAFLSALPAHVIAVFDEAYMEFADDPAFPRMLDYVQMGYPLLVTRTFSKLHGLAGLRIGYAFGRADLIAQVRQMKLPFHSSRTAYVAAAAAVDDQAHIGQSVAMVQGARDYYSRVLQELEIDYLPTQSNYILLTKLPLPTETITRVALEQGVMLRRGEVFNLPGTLRITLARPHENERVIETLNAICA
jgi:histidinol-phosphate aminotransferase